MSGDQGGGGSGQGQAGEPTSDRQAGADFEPLVQEYLDAYLERRRTRLSVGGASAVVAAVVALSGFLYFVYDAVQRTAESAAIKAVKSEDVRSIIDEHRTAARTAAIEAIKTASKVVAEGEYALTAVDEAQKKLKFATDSALMQVGEAVFNVQEVAAEAYTRANEARSVAEKAKSDAQDAAAEIEQNKNIVAIASEEVASALKAFQITLARAQKIQSDINELGGIVQIRKKLDTLGQDEKSVTLLVEQKIKSELSEVFEFLSGAVLVFDKSTGCPTGWSEFREGAGRTIVGVGQGQNLSRRLYRTLGGEEKVTLNIAEMPKHRHGLETVLDNAPLPPPKGAARHVPIAGPYNNRYRRDFYEGANSPHNNMPPYIALYFCEKD